MIEEEGGRIVLRRADDEPALVLKNDILVFTGTAVGDLEAAVTAVRDDRARRRARILSR